MQRTLLAVDRLSTWLGQVFAWTIVARTLGISWEVFSRYVMNEPHDWALNGQIMLYGIPGINQPGAAGNVGRDPGINQPGAACNRNRRGIGR